jgi:hypothetical protein
MEKWENTNSMKIYKVEWLELFAKIETVKASITKDSYKFYGMDNNAKIISYLLGNPSDTPEEAEILIGSIYENDDKISFYTEKYEDKEFCFFYNCETEYKNKKIVFPWEI